jgi:hypothetical protein
LQYHLYRKQKIICKPENHRIDIKEIDFFYCIHNTSFSTLLTNGLERLARDKHFNSLRQYIGQKENIVLRIRPLMPWLVYEHVDYHYAQHRRVPKMPLLRDDLKVGWPDCHISLLALFCARYKHLLLEVDFCMATYSTNKTS